MTLYTVYKNGKGIAALAKNVNFHAHCKGRVREGYINKSIDSAHYIVAALNEKDAQLLGFACVRVRTQSVYVSAMCSHGHQGRACMAQVGMLGKLLGKKEIVLDSIPSATSFYTHIGFVKTKGGQHAKSKGGLVKMHIKI